MPRKTKWTLEVCQAEAKKFTTRGAWVKANKSSYVVAHRHKWLDICCAHMTASNSRSRGYWTLENCQMDAKNYANRKAWAVAPGSGYWAATKRGWLDICCAHMVRIKQPRGYWTLEKCQESAKRYTSRAVWVREDYAAYLGAYHNKWLDICCAHMIKRRRL